ELADDLRRYLDHRPIRARPTGAAQRSWRWARRNPAVAVLAGTAALLILTVLVISTIGYMITSQALAEARGERITAEAPPLATGTGVTGACWRPTGGCAGRPATLPPTPYARAAC